MEIIYLMIPLAVLLVSLIVGAFVWAVKSGQFDDLEGPANRILFDEDELETPPKASPAQTSEASEKPNSD